MDVVTQQIGVLIAFALVLLLLNLKAGSTWLKLITLWTLIGALGAIGYLIVEWVFL